MSDDDDTAKESLSKLAAVTVDCPLSAHYVSYMRIEFPIIPLRVPIRARSGTIRGSIAYRYFRLETIQPRAVINHRQLNPTGMTGSCARTCIVL